MRFKCENSVLKFLRRSVEAGSKMRVYRLNSTIVLGTFPAPIVTSDRILNGFLSNVLFTFEFHSRA